MIGRTMRRWVNSCFSPTAATIVLMICATVAGRDTASSPGDGDESGLDILLPRLARASELFRDSTLKFTCDETITWSGQEIDGGRQKFGYVYVYDEDKGFEDYRTWLRGGGKHPRDVSPSEVGVPAYLRSAFLWVFVFRDSRQDLHRYEIEGEETVLGRPAVKIRFEPIPPYRYKINDWFGWAWIDRQTAQPLKVEAYTPEDWERKQAFESDLGGLNWKSARELGYRIERIVTEFTVDKNGMRFPGTVEIQRSLYKVFKKNRYEEKSLLQVRQVYRNYRFFSVRTAEEIRAIVEGNLPPEESSGRGQR